MSRRILLPWYRFPPFRQEGIGGLSVVVWELTRAMARVGADVTVMVPRGSPRTPDTVDGVTVARSVEADRIASGRKLSNDQERNLSGESQVILSVVNFGAASYAKSKHLRDRIWRHSHMVARNRPISSYLTVGATLKERAFMVLQRRREIRDESLLASTPSICVSTFVRNTLLSEGLASSTSCMVIPNGVDTTAFSARQSSKSFDFLYVGGSSFAKGPDILFQAMKRLAVSLGPIRFAVGGEFSSGSKNLLRGMLGSSPASVTFLGKIERSRMPDTLRSSRFLVMPSRYESFGLPALEAMACGIPVLASRAGGLPEIVDDSVGVLFDSMEPGVIAESIERTAKASTTEDKAMHNGPAKAKTYDWNLIARRTLDVLGG